MKKLIFLIILILSVFCGFSQIEMTDSVYVIHGTNQDDVINVSNPSATAMLYLGAGATYTTGTSIRYFSQSGNGNGLTQSNAMLIDSINTVAVDSGTIMATIGEINTTIIARSNLKYVGIRTNGVKSRLKGTTAVTGWSLYSGNIYKATLANPTNQLFANGVKMQLASNVIDQSTDVYSAITTVESDSVFMVSDYIGSDDYTNAYAVIHSTYYTEEIRKIVDFDNSTGKIWLDKKTGYNLNTGGGGDRMFIANSLDLLDKEGEWCYDSSDSTLYFWGDTSNVEVSTLNYGITGTNVDKVEVKNFDIQGYEISCINFDEDCDSVKIANNIIKHGYKYAISAGLDTNGIALGYANGIAINNNVISDCYAWGVFSRAENATISNNTISNIGLNSQVGGVFDGVIKLTGIETWTSPNSVVTLNDLSSIGYIGINFNGANQEISYNKIDKSMITLRDGAGVYTYNAPGSVVKNNIISNTGDSLSFISIANGFYHDIYNQQDLLTIQDNTIYNTFCSNSYGMLLSHTSYSNINGNVLYNNKNAMLIKEQSAGYNVKYDTIQNNTFYSLYEAQGTGLYGVKDTSLVTFELDSNYYFNSASLFQISLGSTIYTLPQWQTYTSDEANSISNDTIISLFTNVSNKSVNLTPNGTFDSDVSGWINDKWVASSPIDSGGANYDTITSVSSFVAFQKSITADIDTMKITFDIVGESDGKGRLVLDGNYTGYFPIDTTARSYELYYLRPNDGTNGFIFNCYQSNVGDSIWLDNVEVYDVSADYTPPTEKSKLFVNETASAAKPNYEGYNFIDLDGVAIDTTQTIPAYSSIIGIRQE